MKDELKIAAVFIGTIVGAGLASGQEVLQFFSRYGRFSVFGILLCFILYVFMSIVFVSLGYRKKFNSYNDLVCYSLGKKLGFIADIIITLFMFFSNTIMISGGGAMLNEYIGINRIYGSLIMATISFLVAALSTTGVIAINSIIVPLSTSIVVILGCFVFGESRLTFLTNMPSYSGNFVWFSSIIYAAFNFMTSIGVLYPMTKEIKSKWSFIRGCLIGSVVLTILALIVNYNVLSFYPGTFSSEVPNLYVAKNFEPLLPLYLTIIIWLEMFTTEVGCLFSLSKRIQNSLNINYIFALLTITLVSIPFTYLGFANLIKLFYPPFGVISMFILLVGGIKYLVFRK